MTRRVLVRLTEAERELLLTQVDLPPRLRSMVASAQHGVRGWGFTLSDQDAAEIRDRCGDMLTAIGFDHDSSPTKGGLLLESMIDKFFVS